MKESSVEIGLVDMVEVGPCEWNNLEGVLLEMRRTKLVIRTSGDLLNTLIGPLQDGLGHAVAGQFIESFTWNF